MSTDPFERAFYKAFGVQAAYGNLSNEALRKRHKGAMWSWLSWGGEAGGLSEGNKVARIRQEMQHRGMKLPPLRRGVEEPEIRPYYHRSPTHPERWRYESGRQHRATRLRLGTRKE